MLSREQRDVKEQWRNVLPVALYGCCGVPQLNALVTHESPEGREGKGGKGRVRCEERELWEE